MVTPLAVAPLCPQCDADVRSAGTRCASCGFYLPAAPAPRTGPPMARPVPPKDDSKRQTLLVLSIGGVVVLGLLAIGTVVALRSPTDAVSSRLAAPPLPAPQPSVEPARPEPSVLFADARRRALAWHQDAVLVSVEIAGLDARGVAADGSVEFIYARPGGQRFTGGAETGAERLTLLSNGATLTPSETRAGKARVVPEPNCLFEDAWSAAQRAGATASSVQRLRYVWSDKHARPVWEVLGKGSEAVRRLDGVSCSILTR